MSIGNRIEQLARVDMFKVMSDPATSKGMRVGNPFRIDYDFADVLVADKRKYDVGGIPHGSFLLAFYRGDESVNEALLLRTVGVAPLPSDRDIVSSMIEFYKDSIKTEGHPGIYDDEVDDSEHKIDSLTRYEFGFSGLRCRVLGTFYRANEGSVKFGADVENFYSANNYYVMKPTDEVLEYIVNFRDGALVGRPSDVRIGKVRYSSSLRFGTGSDVPVYVSPQDFLGKRTALFGMTRTGKSNSVKKIIEATTEMSSQASGDLKGEDTHTVLNEVGLPSYPVGQIIFDINGEYANPNLQDEGTAIYEIFSDITSRFSVERKEGFEQMKVNFYEDIEAGFELVRSHLSYDSSDYVRSFQSIDISLPESEKDFDGKARSSRHRAAYLCCLYKAGFSVSPSFKVRFSANKTVREAVYDGGGAPSADRQGYMRLSLQEATDFFSRVWDIYDDNNQFRKKASEWASEDLKAILRVLTRKKSPGAAPTVSGYIKLRDISELHSPDVNKPFSEDILEKLRAGRIVIVDLSQGNPEIQALYSERICRQIFSDSMARFVKNQPNNFIQFYFEEAHNLFPKKDDKDLSQIYNRIAKEGAKLNLGLLYATQEVSSISSNILKNTQNWFISHLNNEDETKELRKYYDFADFTSNLVKFSSTTDKGFARMKAYSNPFVVPVQVDKFTAGE